MNNNVIEILRNTLDRIVPISDPKFIIGERNNIDIFEQWIESSNSNGLLGTVIIGQIGNGKTHFLRYARTYYARKKEAFNGIYVPNMFVSGPFVNVLNEIYKSFFVGAGNYLLKEYYDQWEKFKQSCDIEEIEGYQNDIFRWLLKCNNREEAELVLDYYSNKELFPDELKFLKTRFGAKKNFITNESDFSRVTGNAMQFMQVVSGRDILLLFDEVDKVYSSETNTVCLSKVGVRTLTAYRGLFDHLSMMGIRGMICIGTTPEAWDVLSRQTAFERRFKDRTIILKVPKTKEDCLEFVVNRLEEINYEVDNNERMKLKEIVSELSEENMRTWADVISALRKPNTEVQKVEDTSPTTIILEILENTISPLSWNEIVSKSKKLQEMYPKSQPTQLLSKLANEHKIKINSTKPRTYEAIWLEEDYDERD